MWNEELGAFVVILSHGRPQYVKPMQDIVGNATWVITKEEFTDYKNAGAKNCIDGGTPLVHARNVAMNEAFKNDNDCIMLDDDMTNIYQIEIINGKNTKTPIKFQTAVKHMQNYLKETKFKLAGTSPLTNVFWYNMKNPIKFDVDFANFFYIKPNNVMFDENLVQRHDHDFVLHHIVEHGGAISIQYIITQFRWQQFNDGLNKFNKQIGGMNKSLEGQKRSYNYLKKKWGNKLRDHKTKKFYTVFNKGRK